MSNAGESPERLIAQAQAGSAEDLGRLLELYRNYLMVLARTRVDSALRPRIDASDVVQETYLEALRDFGQFEGKSERELVAWLRRILVRNIADLVRRHGAQARDWRRQQSLELALDRSSQAVHQALAAGISTPSVQAARREQSVLLADALARLPDDYRQVIILRHLERLSFPEIARRMGRTAGAIRMLWARALEKLRGQLESPP